MGLASSRQRALLYASVAVVSSCGMVYELTLGTLASYVLGSTVREFCVVLGLYMSAMGLGAWASARVPTDLWRRFLTIELAIALVGGLSAPALLLAVGHARLFTVLVYASALTVGALVGAELPLLIRALEGEGTFGEIVGRGFAYDYLGALIASVLFPVLFVPRLGLVRTGALCGVCNGAVALAGTWALPVASSDARTGRAGLRAACAACITLLAVLSASADAIVASAAD